jgi:hypothetical protein
MAEKHDRNKHHEAHHHLPEKHERNKHPHAHHMGTHGEVERDYTKGGGGADGGWHTPVRQVAGVLNDIGGHDKLVPGGAEPRDLIMGDIHTKDKEQEASVHDEPVVHKTAHEAIVSQYKQKVFLGTLQSTGGPFGSSPFPAGHVVVLPSFRDDRGKVLDLPDEEEQHSIHRLDGEMPEKYGKPQE